MRGVHGEGGASSLVVVGSRKPRNFGVGRGVGGEGFREAPRSGFWEGPLAKT